MSEYDIHNAYKSWRNALLKDCPNSRRTIYNMDKLYKELYQQNEQYNKLNRRVLIKDTLNDKEVLQCVLLH